MSFRGFSAAIVAAMFFNVPSYANEKATSPYAILGPYLGDDGELSSTDYGWLGWKFSSLPAEKSQWSELSKWAIEVSEANRRIVQEQVREIGYDATRIQGNCGSELVCEAILTTGFLHSIGDWPGTQAAIQEVAPLFTAYLSGIESIEASLIPAEQDDLAAELLARTAIEQALRSAITQTDVLPAGLSANGAKVWRMLIWRETVKRDLANTAWLKSAIAADGWPSRSKVGDEAAHAAWLLVQHADRDPAFQITALKLMEPLVSEGEVDPKNYAFLYDRVFGELTGAQRYGTQMICSAGRFIPQEIEDRADLEQRRLRAGLPPLEEQLERFASRTC